MIGLGGIWLTVLGPFVEHRVFVLLSVGFVLTANWAVLILRTDMCPRRRRTGLTLALVCTAFFSAAVTAPHWEGSVMRAIWSYWMDKA